MFDSLDEQMKHDDTVGVTARERAAKWAAIILTSLAVFAGLFIAVTYYE